MAERITSAEIEQLAAWYAQQADDEDRLAASCEASGWPEAAERNRRRAKAHRRTVDVLGLAKRVARENG